MQFDAFIADENRRTRNQLAETSCWLLPQKEQYKVFLLSASACFARSYSLYPEGPFFRGAHSLQERRHYTGCQLDFASLAKTRLNLNMRRVG